MIWEPHCFSRVAAGFSIYDKALREPLVLAQGSPISSRVVRESWGFLSSHCRANRPHVGFCPENPCSSPMATGISVLHSTFYSSALALISCCMELKGSVRSESLGPSKVFPEHTHSPGHVHGLLESRRYVSSFQSS